MKLRITMKDPDGVYDSIRDAIKNSMQDVEGLDEDEMEALADSRDEELNEAVSKWFTYGEYLTVEIDTELGEAVVVPSRR